MRALRHAAVAAVRTVLLGSLLSTTLIAPVVAAPGSAPDRAAEPSTKVTTVGASRSCWLPEEDLLTDRCDGDHLYAGADRRRRARRSLVELDLGPGSLPAGAVVLGAELHLFQDGAQSSGSAASADYALFRPADDWTDWSEPGDELSTTPVTLDQRRGWRTWSVEPEVVQDWAARGGARVMVRQVGAETRRHTAGFRSAAGPRRTPFLAVTFLLPVHVAASGDDSDTGTARRPVRTIQRAIDLAVAGQGIQVGSGTYAGFTVPADKTGLTIDGEDAATVLVDNPDFEVGDLVTVLADGTTLSDLTVQECRPDPAQDGSLETTGSAGVRIDGADDVTVSGVTVRGGREKIEDELGRGCYGIMAHQSWGLDLGHNDVYDNGAGIYVYGGGRGRIHDNLVHDHTQALIRNTSGGGDDFGATGITFDHVLPGRGGYLAEWNTITDNAARSYDYGYDGGGFEIYASSEVVMRNNTLRANDTAVETGADTDSDPDIGCQDNTFSDNQVTGYDDEHPKAPYEPGRLARKGLVLRCDQDMVISGNTVTDTEYGAFMLVVSGGVFDANLDGLQITGNTITQHGLDHFVTIQADLRAYRGLGLADNHYNASRCDWYFSKFWFVSQGFDDWLRALALADVQPGETGSTFTCL